MKSKSGCETTRCIPPSPATGVQFPDFGHSLTARPRVTVLRRVLSSIGAVLDLSGWRRRCMTKATPTDRSWLHHELNLFRLVA